MYLLTKQQADTAGFKLLDLKACGGTATVYKAQHKVTDRNVALKLLNPGSDPMYIQREAQVLSRLHHTNIAKFVDVGEIGSMPYLATEWIDGISLRQMLDQHVESQKPWMNLDLALLLIEPIAGALTHAHAHGVTHGDINPNNILITPEHQAHIIDFGIGRARDDQPATVTTELAGTPRYLAPELISGDRPSASSDQYALALVAYEMLTGQGPYPEHETNAATVLHHQLYSQPAPIQELRPSLSASMNQAFSTALQKSPDRRFDSIESFHDALSNATSVVAPSPDTPSSSRLKTPSIMLGLVVGVLIVSNLWWRHEKSIEPALASISTTGDNALSAASATDTKKQLIETPCNLFANATFDDELDDNFYRDAQYTDLAVRVDHPDAESSPVLQLGNTDQYGVYGVILEIAGGQQYSFRVDLMFRDYVHKAELTILWLDENWQTMEGEEIKQSVERLFDGTFELSNAIAPVNAHYAVPTLYKDASAGIVYADNIRFSVAGHSCN